MELAPIASRQNPLIRQFRRVRDGADRMRVAIEGVRVVEEAVRAGMTFDIVIYSDDLNASDRGASLIDNIRARGIELRRATPGALDAASATETCQGIVALIRRPAAALDLAFAGDAPFVVLAAGISDPGNLGTLIRTAGAAGATAIITTKDTVSPYNDKALRASAGAIFYIPIIVNVTIQDALSRARDAGVRLVATSAAGGEVYYQSNLRPPLLLMLGNEGHGIPPELRRAAQTVVTIPLARDAESLNVAAACAILCFEVMRQAPPAA